MGLRAFGHATGACLILITSAAAVSPSWAAPAAIPAAPAENAATYYRQAFALLPQKPDDPDVKAMKDAGDGPVTAAEAALVRKYDAAAQLLRRGAAVPRCDWGLDRSKGPDLLITHLNPTRTMAYLAALRFRQEMQEKRPAEAYEDAAALMVLARHVGVDPFMVCKLVESGTAMMAVHAAAEGLPQAPPDVLTRFDQRLAALPRSLSPLEVFRAEMASTTAWLRGLEKLDPEPLFGLGPDAKLAQLVGGDNADPKVLMDLKKVWLDPNARAAQVAAIQPTADAASTVFTVRPDQVDQAEAAWEPKRNAAGMLPALVFPKVGNLRRTTDMADVQLAMLRAAIAVRLKGPDVLKTFRDPAGGGPFEYRATPTGFELSSKLQYKGKPVTLTAGPEAKS